MKMIDIKYKFSAVVVLTLSLLAGIVRRILFPEIPWDTEILIYFASLIILSFVTSVYFIIHNLLNKYYPFTRGVAKRIVLQLFLGLLFMFSFRALMLSLDFRPVPIDMNKMFIIVIVLVDFFVCMAVNFAFFTEHFFTQWKASYQKAQKLEKEKTLVQYDNLKNQLNPHFLFNALASLNTLIYENQDQASQFLKQLSKVYRYLLENKEVVCLQKELEFVQNYLSLLKTRFEDALIVEINIDPVLSDYMIVPVTIQNLLENAVKHNTITLSRPLHIHIYTEEDYLCIENTLQKKNLVQDSNKQGLVNLRNLYKYLVEKEIVVTEAKDKFTVKIPLIH